MRQTPNVVIRGMGIVSAIGLNVAENLDSLRRARTGIRPLERVDSVHRGSLLAGEVALANDELYRLLGLSQHDAYTRTSLLAMLAMREAMAGIDMHDGRRTGLVSATTVGGMDATERYFDDYLETPSHHHFIPTHPCGYFTEQLAEHYGIRDYVTTISTACSSAANAIMLGARMIKAGILDRVVVGGADSLSKFTVNGFNSLMIYSDTYCTPFDEHRKGLNLGEAAAFLVLERDDAIAERKPSAYLSGYGNANDAFHQTASSEAGEGALLAMQTALQVAGLAPEDIGYVNAHGTATPNNDLSEGRAMVQLFGGKDNIPPFSSTKAFTGHTLAAAGAIEAVYSVLALSEQAILPNLNFNTPIADLGIVPETRWQSADIQHVLSSSLGFGGNCTSLVFSKYP